MKKQLDRLLKRIPLLMLLLSISAYSVRAQNSMIWTFGSNTDSLKQYATVMEPGSSHTAVMAGTRFSDINGGSAGDIQPHFLKVQNNTGGLYYPNVTQSVYISSSDYHDIRPVSVVARTNNCYFIVCMARESTGNSTKGFGRTAICKNH